MFIFGWNDNFIELYLITRNHEAQSLNNGVYSNEVQTLFDKP